MADHFHKPKVRGHWSIYKELIGVLKNSYSSQRNFSLRAVLFNQVFCYSSEEDVIKEISEKTLNDELAETFFGYFRKKLMVIILLA